MFIVILILVLFIVYLFLKGRKVPKLGDVTCITGGVKTGKSTLALHLARRKYKSNLLKWRIVCVIKKILRKPLPEKPLFYSNIRLAFDYVPVTERIFMRDERLAYKSVMYVQESSLIADSMDWKSKELNENLKLFNKLYGHETHGGSLFYDTQTMSDNHYSIKRVMNSYLWIHHAVKWIPFVYLCHVREMFFSSDGEMVNIAKDDPEDTLKWIIVPKKIWKYFDCYTYSVFTDHLPIANTLRKYSRKNLKTDYIVNLKRGK